MKTGFARANKVVLVYEGGKVNNPKDPGGRTNQGVTQRVYDAYRRSHGLELRTVYAMVATERDAIYRKQYWDAIRADELPGGVDLVVYDGAVNSGPVQSVKWLQRALGAKVDGHIGQATIDAVKCHPDHDKLIADTLARRLGFLCSLKTWSTFGGGWTKRVNNLKKIGQAWASGSVGPAPVAVEEDGGHAKAAPEAISVPTVSPEVGTTSTVTAATAAEAASKAQDAATQLQPLADTFEILKYICIALTIVAVAATIYGFYRSRKARKAETGEAVAELEDVQEAA